MNNDVSTYQTLKIDRSSPMPAYQQIANDIAGRISRGEWELNERLPSENQLADEYEVSRVTLRQALAQLEKDDLIVKFQGKGIFVKSNPRLVVQDLALPSPDLKQKKPALPSKVLVIRDLAEPIKPVNDRLKLRPNELLVYLQRIFYNGDRPIGLSNVWFPRSAVPALAEDGLYENSISKTLYYRYRHRIVTVDNYMEAIKLDAASAALLNSVYDAPAIMISSCHYPDSKKPVEFASTIWLGEATRFHIVSNSP